MSKLEMEGDIKILSLHKNVLLNYMGKENTPEYIGKHVVLMRSILISKYTRKEIPVKIREKKVTSLKEMPWYPNVAVPKQQLKFHL